jgi:hypothetical protein
MFNKAKQMITSEDTKAYARLYMSVCKEVAKASAPTLVASVIRPYMPKTALLLAAIPFIRAIEK